MNARVVAALGAVVVAVAVFALWPKKKLSPEDEVRAVIADCVSAAERKDVSAIVDHLDPSFVGPNGTSRDETKSVLVGHLFRNDNQTVILNPTLDVKIESADSATFSGMFIFARGKAATPEQPGDGASRYDMSGNLQKRSDGWKLTRVEMKR